jgi:hypothetical protein
MTLPDDLSVSLSSDAGGPYLEVLGRRIRRPEAEALAANVLSTLGEDAFSRGVLTGRRAALREAAQAIAAIGEGASPSPPPAPRPPTLPPPADPAPKPVAVKSSGGLDPRKLERFLRATSDDPKALTPLPPPTAPVMPVRRDAPPLDLDPAPVVASQDDADSDGSHDDPAARYVARRATEWWEHAKRPDVDSAVRIQARAISAELYEIAEELRRAEHLRGARRP